MIWWSARRLICVPRPRRNELASKWLTLSFTGTTAADQSAFDTWCNAVDPAAAHSRAATANMVSAIKLDGVAQTGEAGSGTGTSTLALVWNALGHLQTAIRTGTGAIT